MKKLGLFAVFASGLVAFFMGSYSTILCGCTDAATNLSLGIGAHPLRSDGATVRAKLLEKLPPGTPYAEVREFLKQVSPGAHASGDPCVRTPGRLSCRHVVKRKMWEDEGFEMRFTFDAANRLADAQVLRF